MRPRSAALGLWAALTFSCAVIVHGVIHAVGAGGFVWDSPAHVVMLAFALSLLAAVAVPLGLVGPARERRRRLALVRAGLGPATLSTTTFGALIQGAIAFALLAAEGVSLDPARLVLTLVCGLIALLCSALLFRATRDRVVALLVGLIAAAYAAPILRASLRCGTPRPAYATEPYRLLVPNRPPPAVAI